MRSCLRSGCTCLFLTELYLSAVRRFLEWPGVVVESEAIRDRAKLLLSAIFFTPMVLGSLAGPLFLAFSLI